MALKVTKSAWERLVRIQSTRPQLTAIRLTHSDGKPLCCPGHYRPHDVVIEQNGYPAILMTSQVAAELNNHILHAPGIEGRRRLRLRQAA